MGIQPKGRKKEESRRKQKHERLKANPPLELIHKWCSRGAGAWTPGVIVG